MVSVVVVVAAVVVVVAACVVVVVGVAVVTSGDVLNTDRRRRGVGDRVVVDLRVTCVLIAGKERTINVSLVGTLR